MNVGGGDGLSDEIARTIKDVFRASYRDSRTHDLRAAGHYAYFTPIGDTDGTEVTVKNRRLVMLGSNNYLGLTHHPDVIAAATRATARFGTSPTGSRLLNGNLELHEELERRLAAFVGKEAAVVFATGYQTNVGTIGSIAQRGDVIFGDRANHASLIDGCALSFARSLAYRHNSVTDLERLLAEAPPEQGRLIVADGVFSMEGDLVDLPGVAAAARRHGARVMIDDAHGLGVMGPDGRGTAAHFGLTDHVDVITASFSKSLASVGGFVASEAAVVEHIRHSARAFLFSAGLPAGSAAAALAALEVLQRERWRIDAARKNADYLKTGLSALGYDIGATQSQIVPIITGNRVRTLEVWRELFDEGVFVNAAIPPAVPASRCLLRASCTAEHTREHLDRALRVFERVRQNRSMSTLA